MASVIGPITEALSLLRRFDYQPRQTEDKAGRPPRKTGQADIAPMLAGETPGGGQSQSPTPARGPARIEWIEQVLALQRRRPLSIVFNNHLDAVDGRRLQTHTGPAVHGCGLDGVAEQVGKSSPYLDRVRIQDQRLFDRRKQQTNLMLPCEVFQGGDDFADELAQVERFLVGPRGRAKAITSRKMS